jgi:hypothetical protein
MEAEQIRQNIADTRQAIDRDLDALDRKARQLRDEVRDQATAWLPVAAIGVGLVGTVAFWPRRHRRVVHVDIRRRAC